MEYLANSGRTAPRCAKAANKNEHIARYQRKRMALGFTGFAKLIIPGQVIDLKLTKTAKFSLEDYIKKLTMRYTREVCF